MLRQRGTWHSSITGGPRRDNQQDRGERLMSEPDEVWSLHRRRVQADGRFLEDICGG